MRHNLKFSPLQEARSRLSFKLLTALNVAAQRSKRFVLDATPPYAGKVPKRLPAEVESALLFVASRQALAEHGHCINPDIALVLHDHLKVWNAERVVPVGEAWVTVERRNTYDPYDTYGQEFLTADQATKYIGHVEAWAFERGEPCVYGGRRGDRALVGELQGHNVVSVPGADERAAHKALAEAGATRLLDAWIEKLAQHDEHQADRRKPYAWA